MNESQSLTSERHDITGFRPHAHPPTLIVIGGAPAAGKSTLARELRVAWNWPLLAKRNSSLACRLQR